MDIDTYKEKLKHIEIGKSLPEAIYVHKLAIHTIPPDITKIINTKTKIHNLQTLDWNILKLSKNSLKFSLLHYPDFFTESYPQLATSCTVDCIKKSYRINDYTNSDNPPILHRKETMLVPDHPSVPLFKQITREGEQAGLYKNTRKIGFKRPWEKLIKQQGYQLVKGRLKKLHNIHEKTIASETTRIERHKTAIDRNSLSAPMQSLFRHDFLKGKYSLFDYGCGKGDDLNILANHDVTAKGWDPVYYPDNKIEKADIVNLGFVINVIENPKERKDTLQKAYRFTRKILVTSVMLGGDAITNKFEKYGDGVVTSRKTFQKYYSQTEFREYLQNALGETTIAVGPGIFYTFKDKLEEQQFLVERQRVKRNWQKLSYTDHPERLKIKQRALYKRHKELFKEFWLQCLDLGRLPANNEFTKSEELRALCSSHQKGLELLTTIHGAEPFSKATEARRDDLLVHYALSLFGQGKPYKHMPERLKRDIKNFFGNYTTAIKEATELLFSVGKPELINQYCEQAHKNLGRGRLENNHSLTIHRNDVELLPPPLRVYIGCATQLYGDIETVDLVKIHIRSGKVSLMRYDDFEGKPLPLLQERIKIKLREQAIDFFEYGEKFKPQPVYLKSEYIHDEFPNYKRQASFDKQLLTFSWANLKGYGPPIKEFNDDLEKLEGLKLKGFTLSRG